MKTMLMAMFLFFIINVNCDGGGIPAIDLLALQIKASPSQIETGKYELYGGYVIGNSISTFKIYNNYLPKKFTGYNVSFIFLQFNKSLREYSSNLFINGQWIPSYVQIYDYKWIAIDLYRFTGDSFIITGTVTDYDGQTTFINTPLITYK